MVSIGFLRTIGMVRIVLETNEHFGDNALLFGVGGRLLEATMVVERTRRQ
jgi:hypothetical protein